MCPENSANCYSRYPRACPWVSNEIEPEYISDIPSWLKDKDTPEEEIGEPVGCPKCLAWGVDNFEIIDKEE